MVRIANIFVTSNIKNIDHIKLKIKVELQTRLSSGIPKQEK